MTEGDILVVIGALKCCLLTTEGAKDLADKVGGKAMITLSEVENFHPEEGMALANTISVGIKCNIDQTPYPKFAPNLYVLKPRLCLFK